MTQHMVDNEHGLLYPRNMQQYRPEVSASRAFFILRAST